MQWKSASGWMRHKTSLIWTQSSSVYRKRREKKDVLGVNLLSISVVAEEESRLYLMEGVRS